MSFEATPLAVFAKVMSFLTNPMMKSMMKACVQDLDDIRRPSRTVRVLNLLF